MRLFAVAFGREREISGDERLRIDEDEDEQQKRERHADHAADQAKRRSQKNVSDRAHGGADLARDFVGLRQSIARRGITFRERIHARANSLPD